MCICNYHSQFLGGARRERVFFGCAILLNDTILVAERKRSRLVYRRHIARHQAHAVRGSSEQVQPWGISYAIEHVVLSMAVALPNACHFHTQPETGSFTLLLRDSVKQEDGWIQISFSEASLLEDWCRQLGNFVVRDEGVRAIRDSVAPAATQYVWCPLTIYAWTMCQF